MLLIVLYEFNFPCCLPPPNNAEEAQMAEQLIVDQKVIGSTPVLGIREYKVRVYPKYKIGCLIEFTIL